MINIEQKADCCGCTACLQICPQQCVSMAKDAEGFLYPQADPAGCVNCGLCEKVCPQLVGPKAHSEPFAEPYACGGWHKNEAVRAKSSSGGVFTLLAEHILSVGGCVYGCVLNKDLKAVHIRAEDSSGIEAMRGSKYVQSDINRTYAAAWADLKAGRPVLFTGTPCQAAGLHCYIECKAGGSKSADSIWERLYICDFICHGVPSPMVFASYIHQMEEQYGDKIISFKFRTKDRQWNPTGLQLGTGTGTGTGLFVRKYPGYKDVYMNGFLSDLYLRPSCHSCRFKYIPKDYSDFTIADFWGVNRLQPTLMDGRGTSLLLIHNHHGYELFAKVKSGFHYEETDYKKAVAHNKPLLESAAPNPKREKFFKDYNTQPFKKVERKYMKASDWFIHRLGGVLAGFFEKLVRKVWGAILYALHIQWNEKQWLSFLQFARFCVVGLSNAFVSYTINITTLFALKPCGFEYDYVVANCVAFLLSVLWSFYWNSNYVFAAQKGEQRSKIKTLLKMYASYAVSGVILNNLLGTFWIKIVGISKFISPLLNIPITVGINFAMNKYWTFNHKH